MEEYDFHELIGEGGTLVKYSVLGTYGSVYRCSHKRTGKNFAVKVMRLFEDDEGIPSAALREVALLKVLNHPNVMRLEEVKHDQENLFIVVEQCDTDLKKYFDTLEESLSPLIVKDLFQQVLRGLLHCHIKQILHRDLKPQNILLNLNNMQVKLADFGLARAFGIPVVTLWYRPPDILFGAKLYTASVDIWSSACILAEIASNGKPLFPGNNVTDQLRLIFRVTGVPSERSWSKVSTLPDYKVIVPYSPMLSFSEMVPTLEQNGIALLKHPTPQQSSPSISPYQVSNVRASPPTSAPPPPPVPAAPRHPINPHYQSISRNSQYAYPQESLWIDKFVRRENRGMLRLCLIELFLAAVVMAGGIWCARDTPEYCPYYSAIWTSFFFLVNAVVGILAAKTGVHNLYVAHLVLSIISLVMSVAGSVIAFRNWTLIGTYHHPKVNRDTAFCLLGEHDATRLSYIFTNMDQYDFKTCLFSLKLGVGVNSVHLLVAALLGVLNIFSVIFCLRRGTLLVITTISNLKRPRVTDGLLENCTVSGAPRSQVDLDYLQGPPTKKYLTLHSSTYDQSYLTSLSQSQPHPLLSSNLFRGMMTPGVLNGVTSVVPASNVLVQPFGMHPTSLINSYSAYPSLLTQPGASSPLTYEGSPFFQVPHQEVSKLDSSACFNVFVGDLSQDVDNSVLHQAFAKFGQIAEAKVIRDLQSTKSRGYGFVSFWKQEDAQMAIDEMNGQVVGKRAVRTNWATRKNNENKRTTTYDEVLGACDGENTSVYLGNIGPDVSESEIRERFEKFGAIKQVRLFTPKNYGFVVFDTKENAAKAIHEFSGQDIKGHVLTCSWGKLSEQSPKVNPLLMLANMNRLVSAQLGVLPSLAPPIYSTPFIQTWR